MQQLSEQGAADIRLHEGVVSHWYLDSTGTPTIGIGFTWGSAGFQRWWKANRPGQPFAKGATMTRQECEECLIMVMDGEYGAYVNKFFGKDVPQHVFDAACSVVYNCGPGALKWQWAQAMKSGDYPQAAALLKTTAITSKGKRLQGLVNRRNDEANLLKNGVYASGGVSVADETPQMAPKADKVAEPSKPIVPVTAAVAVAAGAGDIIDHWNSFTHWIGSFF
jgi:lysozyme